VVLLRANDIEPPPVISPVSGAIVDLDDNDECLKHYLDAQQLEQELRQFKARLRDAVWSRTEATEQKTRHVVGRRYQASIVAKDPEPQQPVLRQILRHFPDAAKQVIVPASYRVDAVQWKKMKSTSSQCEDYIAVKNMVHEAINSGTVPPPYITKILPVE